MRIPLSWTALLSASLFLSTRAAADDSSGGLPGGVEFDTLRAGDCSHKAVRYSHLQVYYKLRLQGKEDVIESNYEGRVFSYTHGARQVIPGWDVGLTDMCLGELRKLTIPPDYAYGAHGNPPAIPGDATLVFDVELVGIDKFTVPKGGAAAAASSSAASASSSTLASASASASTATSSDMTFGIATAPPVPSSSATASPTAEPQAEATDALGNAIPPPDLPVVDVPPPFASTSPTTATEDQGDKVEDTGECRLLGPFAIFVQGALGALALLSLVYKRWRETPRRPLKIWSFDVSKQVVGSVLLHGLNLLFSMLSSGQFDVTAAVKPGNPVSLFTRDAGFVQDTSDPMDRPNPCSFYLLNLAIDTTIGIPILVILLRILHALFLYTPLAHPPESLRSGNYGQPPRTLWWLKQSFIYFLGLFGMKLCVYALLQMLPWLAWVGDWALRWTEGNEALQIAFVMLVFPLVMNALQYWIIDSFIKDPAGGSGGAWNGHEQVPQDEDDIEERRRLHADDDEDSEVEEMVEDDTMGVKKTLKEANPTPVLVYDEHMDGQGSSGSSRGPSRGGSDENKT